MELFAHFSFIVPWDMVLDDQLMLSVCEGAISPELAFACTFVVLAKFSLFLLLVRLNVLVFVFSVVKLLVMTSDSSFLIIFRVSHLTEGACSA